MNDTTAVATPLVNKPLVRWHIVLGVTWLAVALLAGLLYALQLLQAYPLPKIALFSPGRIRMAHTNMVAFGFLVNGFLAMLYWTVPRLTGRRIADDRLGWLIFAAWNGIVAATFGGLLLGEAQAVEWGETPVWVDPVVVLGAILVWIQFYTPIVKSAERSMYVSLWYFSAGFIWLGLTYIMGNFFPQYLVAGNAAGPLLGLYIHDLVGLFVTPMGWGMMYFFVPILLKRPIWSHALSLVGFWGLAFFYPLQGVHHFLGSPIPMFAQYAAVITTIAIEIVVATVIINFFMTWKAVPGALRTSIPIRWFWLGALNYAITCLQCSFQVTLTFQQVIHFTDWVVGHAHLVMFGVFSFWIFGMIEHLWPKVTGHEWWSEGLRRWFFWLTATGLSAMFVILTAGGIAEGFLSLNLAPRETILEVVRPFWIVRAFTGVAIIAGFLCLVTNMWMTARASAAAHVDADYAPYETDREAAVGTV